MAAPNDFAHLSDEALVSLVARSDDDAFAELYDRYGSLAYGLARRVLRDASLAEDAVQDAFLTIWRTASRFSSERAPARVWILTLVHRRAVDLVRHHERRRADPLPPTRGGRRRRGGRDPLVSLERDRVRNALRQLPDQQREAIELAYYGGFTQSELAERLGQPLGTIKSRMFSGLARLRELLEDATSEGDRGAGRDSRADGPYALDALDPGGGGVRGAPAPLRGVPRRGRDAARDRRVARARAPPAPPPAELRERILASARAERGTVVPFRPRWSAPIAAVAAVAACAASPSASGRRRSEHGRHREAALRTQERALAVAASPGARRIALSGGHGVLVVTPAGRAALLLSELPKPPPGKVFEAWVIKDENATPAGLFSARGTRPPSSSNARFQPAPSSR